MGKISCFCFEQFNTKRLEYDTIKNGSSNSLYHVSFKFKVSQKSNIFKDTTKFYCMGQGKTPKIQRGKELVKNIENSTYGHGFYYFNDMKTKKIFGNYKNCSTHDKSVCK